MVYSPCKQPIKEHNMNFDFKANMKYIIVGLIVVLVGASVFGLI